jgi:hypothetical protein
MEVLLFGTSTDRQVYGVYKNGRISLSMTENASAIPEDAIRIFVIEEGTGCLTATHEDRTFYLPTPTTAIQDKKIKPVYLSSKVPEDSRMRFMKFHGEDEDANDYVVSDGNSTYALVDHPKFEKCGVGNAGLASPFYVSSVSDVVPQSSSADLGSIATAIVKNSKDRKSWVEQLSPSFGLSGDQQERFVGDDFETAINRRVLVFAPHAQEDRDTAAQILLRRPLDDEETYCGAIGVEADELGKSNDQVWNSCVLGPATKSTVALVGMGQTNQVFWQLIGAALRQVSPPNVVIDATSTGASAEDIQALSEKFPTKNFIVAFTDRKTGVPVAEKLHELDISNVEVHDVRSSASKLCRQRAKSGMPFCAVYRAADNMTVDSGPLHLIDNDVKLFSPCWSTNQLVAANWVKV